MQEKRALFHSRILTPRRLIVDCGVFVAGSALVGLVVLEGVPFLSNVGMDPLAAWMALSVPCVFVPIVAAGLLVLRSESGWSTWAARLRLRLPSARDWFWGLVGLVVMGVGSGLAMEVCWRLGLSPNPPFLRDLQPLTGDRLWMIGLWAVYWPINILGEEFVWRGVFLPRMEEFAGSLAWLLNALLWGAFHLAFGAGNLLVLLPTLILVPLMAQRRRSTWLAVLLHAGLSGPGFVALALGAV